MVSLLQRCHISMGLLCAARRCAALAPALLQCGSSIGTERSTQSYAARVGPLCVCVCVCVCARARLFSSWRAVDFCFSK